MLDETIRFFGEHPATKVRDVRFILLRKKEKVIDAFTQELNRQQETFVEKEKQNHIASPGIQSGCGRSINVQHITVGVVHGDLTNEESNAIANIINPDMDMQNAGEVSKAIPRVCGESPKQECRQLGTQQAGSVVITSGGTLRFCLIGKDKESVDTAVEELKNDFSETCITKDIRDEICEEFTAEQIDSLMIEAENMDVEMTFEVAMGSVTLSGIKEDVFAMTEKIQRQIDQVKKREKEKKEEENAKLVSNTIQWFYALHRRGSIPFDTSANLEIERAYFNDDDKVEVVSSGEKFEINFRENSGLKQPRNQRIKVTRKLMGAKGTKFKIILKDVKFR